MPCRSDYMEANGDEREISQVACLLDELDGKEYTKSQWAGYHPKVYNKMYNADEWVASLCSRLQTLDVTEYSLEMQIWWRDHQEADKKMLEREIEENKTNEEREAALAKLSDYERQLLGV